MISLSDPPPICPCCGSPLHECSEWCWEWSASATLHQSVHVVAAHCTSVQSDVGNDQPQRPSTNLSMLWQPTARVFRVMLGMVSLRMSKKKEERINSERINDGHRQNIDKWKRLQKGMSNILCTNTWYSPFRLMLNIFHRCIVLPMCMWRLN